MGQLRELILDYQVAIILPIELRGTKFWYFFVSCSTYHNINGTKHPICTNNLAQSLDHQGNEYYNRLIQFQNLDQLERGSIRRWNLYYLETFHDKNENVLLLSFVFEGVRFLCQDIGKLIQINLCL